MTHSSLDTLGSAQVGDYLTVTLVESLTDAWFEAFMAAGLDIAEGSDNRLIVVDAE